jgi:acetyl esterase/lipase
MLADYLTKRDLSPAPIGIIDLYGYYDLTDDFVWRPSEHYLAMPRVSRDTVARMRSSDPLSSASKSTRFALYVYARQSGRWAKLLGLADKEAARRHSLDSAALSRLPPLFIAASTGDEDVPYAVSKRLLRVASPSTVMKTVYYLEHDFDRDVSRPEGIRVYRQIIDWIAGLTQ